MGRRGPKAEPAAVKLAKGNPGRRKIAAPAPIETHDGALIAPNWLNDDALQVWRRLAPDLARQKLLSATDALTFGRYCRNFAEWLKLKRSVDEGGYTYEIETASGRVIRPNPHFNMAEKIEAKLLAQEDTFGLNPAKRYAIFAALAGRVGDAGDLFAPLGGGDKQEAAAESIVGTLN